MSNIGNQLYIDKTKLEVALGDNAKQYWSIHKRWFKGLYTRTELDYECRKLLRTQEESILHNNFIISLVRRTQMPEDVTVQNIASSDAVPVTEKSSKIHKSSSSSEASKRKRSRNSSSNRPFFEPADLYESMSSINTNPKKKMYGNGTVLQQRFASQELFLPDKTMVLGRLLLTAWDQDMEGAEDTVAEIIVQGVQIFLKNILSAVIFNRKGYKTYDKYFKYDAGCSVPNPWVRNSANILDHWSGDGPKSHKDNGLLSTPLPTIDRAEQEAAFMMACSGNKPSVPRGRITAHHLYDALKYNKNIIPNNIVYALSIEEICLEMDDREIASAPIQDKSLTENSE